MSSGLKKLLSFLFIALSITAVFFIAFSNEDLSNAFDAIRQMNFTWPQLLVLSQGTGIQNQRRARGECGADRFLLLQYHPQLRRRTADAGQLHA